MYNIYGQNPVCLPNPIYKDSAAGIYPRPYNDSTMLGGITKAACIDQDYEFPLTVIIPDMITIPFGGTNITVGLESARLDTANAVVGLPKGIRYFCNPGNCIMDKNKPGCVILKGRVTADNKPGIYNLVIKLKLVTFLGTFDVDFPGSFFPGKYFLIVPPKDSSVCSTSELRVYRSYDGFIKAFPIPSQNILNVAIDAQKSGQIVIRLADITGRTVFDQKASVVQGQNTIPVPVGSLSNGTYSYTVASGITSTTKRFVVWHH